VKIERRPIAARSTRWATAVAKALARAGVTPNQISLASLVFAALGAAALVQGSPAALVLAAAAIQLRLLCNLFDGMVAVEGGQLSPLGSLYNELPDRVSDSVLLVAGGYAAQIPWIGWLCALLAVSTAYIRASGASLGNGQDFQGPMAKPQRMAVLTLACLIQAIPHAPAGSLRRRLF